MRQVRSALQRFCYGNGFVMPLLGLLPIQGTAPQSRRYSTATRLYPAAILDHGFGDCRMTRPFIRPLLAAAALTLMPIAASAQNAAATPWVLAPNVGYGYDSHFKTMQYKLGTNNAGLLLKGARKVPKNTLFFLGANGQLYMRTGPFLESDGSFMFGPG
jgi:hypothetical protein